MEIIKLKVICCFGNYAAKKLLDNDKPLQPPQSFQPSQKFQSFRGKVHNYNGIPVVCTHYPTKPLSHPHAKEIIADIQLLKETMKPVPKATKPK